MSLEFKSAAELKPIVDKLIELFYPHLLGADVEIVYRSKTFPDSPATVARIEKLTGFKAWLYRRIDGENEPLFLIQVVVPNWIQFNQNQQIAILDHELCHIWFNAETDALILRPHPIEEFPEIVERHGAWHDGLVLFHHALQRSESDTSTRDEIINRILEK